jgi:hypothetical protein
MIRTWRKQEQQLKEANPNNRNLHRGTANWPELEEELKTWILDQRRPGITVSTEMIIHRARLLAMDRNIIDFTGSPSWCFRFMKINNLCMQAKTKISQNLPAEYEDKIVEFHRFVINARKQEKFELSQIANMDQVPLAFDVPSNKTVDSRGAKSIIVKTYGHEKTHYNVLSCCADGTKLPPFFIFKRKTLPKEKLPAGIYVHAHPKGWMDG